MLVDSVSVYNSITTCRLLLMLMYFAGLGHQCVKIVVMQTCFQPPNDQYLLEKNIIYNINIQTEQE